MQKVSRIIQKACDLHRWIASLLIEKMCGMMLPFLAVLSISLTSSSGFAISSPIPASPRTIMSDSSHFLLDTGREHLLATETTDTLSFTFDTRILQLSRTIVSDTSHFLLDTRREHLLTTETTDTLSFTFDTRILQLPRITILDTLSFIFDTRPLLFALYTKSGHGDILKEPDAELYEDGSSVTLTAAPDTGWYFIGWLGDIPSERKMQNPLTLVMDTTRTLSAQYEITNHSLSIKSEHGIVVVDPELPEYVYGSTVILKANSNNGYEFLRWDGDILPGQEGDNPLTLIMNENREILAIFEKKKKPGAIFILR